MHRFGGFTACRATLAVHQGLDRADWPRRPMIRFLSIRDLAVIDTLEIELETGLNVLTGETGAGKSIVIGALGLLRGGRTSAELVRTGAAKAVVEAVIEGADGAEQVVRREISAQGRSRAFVDDRLVSSNVLRGLGVRLMDLHGQHGHQALLDPDSHLELLDRFAGLGDQRMTVRDTHTAWRHAVAALDRARGQAAERAERADLVAFQLRELDDAELVAQEDAALEAEQKILANADRVHRLAAHSIAELYDGDGAALDTLDRVWKRVAELATLDQTFAPYLEAKDTVVSQLQDLAFALRAHASGIDASPERLQQVEDRLATLDRLKRRYGPSLDDVLARREELRRESGAIGSGAEQAAILAARVTATAEAYLRAARSLSAARRAHAGALADTLERSVADLAMAQTRFAVRFADPAADDTGWTDRGIDRAEFFFSANPGEAPKPLARIASGGELSRLMLALRTITSVDGPGKTLVFDEVDAGIGGEAAARVGAKLRALAADYQILCVTHLPQIAGYGTSHYRVSKAVLDGRTTTTVVHLDSESRAVEIARMMTGARVSDTVLQTARELLKE